MDSGSEASVTDFRGVEHALRLKVKISCRISPREFAEKSNAVRCAFVRKSKGWVGKLQIMRLLVLGGKISKGGSVPVNLRLHSPCVQHVC